MAPTKGPAPDKPQLSGDGSDYPGSGPGPAIPLYAASPSGPTGGRLDPRHEFGALGAVLVFGQESGIPHIQ